MIRKLPRWVAITIWIIGFVLVLTGELLAVGTAVDGDTISEIVWWLIGVGEGVTWYFLAARIFLFGLLAWLILHFGTKKV